MIKCVKMAWKNQEKMCKIDNNVLKRNQILLNLLKIFNTEKMNWKVDLGSMKWFQSILGYCFSFDCVAFIALILSLF